MNNNEIQTYLLGVIITSSGFLMHGFITKNDNIILLSGLIPLTQLIMFYFLREDNEEVKQ